MASELHFGIKLDDGVSAGADKAAASLTKMQHSLEKVAAAEQRLGRMQSQALGMNDARDKKELAALAKKAKAEDAEIQRMGRMQSQALGMAAAMEKASKEAMAATWKELGEVVGKAAHGFKMVAEAALLVGTAVAGATLELLKFGMHATESKKRAVTMLQAMGDGSDGSGKKMFDMLDGLSGRLPQSRGELTKWTRSLEALGITDMTEVRGQLVALSSAQALNAEGGAEAYERMMTRVRTFKELGEGLKVPVRGLGSLKEMGLNVVDVANEMGISAHVLGEQLKAGTADAGKFGAALEIAVAKKGRAPLQGLMGDFSTVLAKGKESFEKLFDAIDFKPLAEAAGNFFAIIGGGEASGKQMKSGIGGALNSIVSSLGEATETAEFWFLTVELWSVKNKASIKMMWAAGLEAGGMFVNILKEASRELGGIAKMVIKVGEGIGWIGAHTGLIDVKGATPLTPEQWQAQQSKGLPAAPAHASGGLVMQPAPGEAFASVAPGEYILPKDRSPYSATSSPASTAADPMMSGGKGGVHVDRMDLHIEAPGGVTNANEITVTGLTMALERLQLAVGR